MRSRKKSDTAVSLAAPLGTVSTVPALVPVLGLMTVVAGAGGGAGGHGGGAGGAADDLAGGRVEVLRHLGYLLGAGLGGGRRGGGFGLGVGGQGQGQQQSEKGRVFHRGEMLTGTLTANGAGRSGPSPRAGPKCKLRATSGWPVAKLIVLLQRG